ncbi:2OG-Fe(II) oxygenase [Phenylobacterium sp.]|uniref:2OG-Fe(II) oxygenase n=1 Tax=Phenylobacterium sp. TaxID=1871053 RepID=UPI0012167F9A|nr:2OG-Fe(II) oxygenase [Phenylobacterium sp.]THD58037.1 MAG: redoxin domain-containing protein [Phenylobacterium sp.]
MSPSPVSWSPSFAPGDPAPWFTAATPATQLFHFSTVVGRYTVLGFLPPPGPAREAALAAVQSRRGLFDDDKVFAFFVIRDADSIAQAQNQPPGLRWFFDPDGAISRLYGVLDADGAEHPFWLLLDPSHRTLGAYPIGETDALMAAVVALPALADYAGAELVAPVLVLPRVIEPEVCRRLIDLYDAHGGAPSGVMRDIGGRTVGVLDDFKKRRDMTIEDADLRQGLLQRISRRIAPEIAKVFQFKVTRVERYIVACYDAAEGGYFRPHRDNETLGTMHRKFAVSINLNAEEHEGGDLRFPEFGPRTYRPPTGGAVIFSCSLQHEATPVTRGRRYAFLPFLYDEAGQAVRTANFAHLERLAQEA